MRCPALLVLVLVWIVGTPAVAAPGDTKSCNLVRLSSLELMTEPNGLVAVPANIDGIDGLLAIDTGGVNNVIGQSVAAKLGLEISDNGPQAAFFGGVAIHKKTSATKLQLGLIMSKDIPMMVVPSALLQTDEIGMLAPNYLSHFDIEFDFAGTRFNIYSPDHCAGQVVYWTQTGYSAVPFNLSPAGHIVATAMLDTGSDRSVMTFDSARSLFGIQPGDPKLIDGGEVSINGLPPTKTYRYKFATLDLNGVHVQGPQIDIVVGERFKIGESDLILGIQTLRQLRMYIAYKEQTLYVTSAEAN